MQHQSVYTATPGAAIVIACCQGQIRQLLDEKDVLQSIT